MPKIGSTVSTPDGKGTVIGMNMLTSTVKVKIEKDGNLAFKDFPLSLVKFTKRSGDDEIKLTAEEEKELKKLETE